jgi:outer membrane lipoprotein-sorting protein
MNILRRVLVGVVLALGIGSWALAQEPQAVLARVDENMAPGSLEMYRKLINIEPTGDRREYVLYTLTTGRDRVANLFLSPPSEEGRITLRVGDSIWLAIPEAPQPLRVPVVHPVVGRLFNNWDLMRTQLGADYAARSLTKEGDSFILELKAKGPSVVYDRLKLWVDADRLLPRRIEVYAESGLHLKTLDFKEVKDFGDGIVRPAVLETRSPLLPGYRAIMLTSKIRRRDIPEETFAIANIRRIGDLR